MRGGDGRKETVGKGIQGEGFGRKELWYFYVQSNMAVTSGQNTFHCHRINAKTIDMLNNNNNNNNYIAKLRNTIKKWAKQSQIQKVVKKPEKLSKNISPLDSQIYN